MLIAAAQVFIEGPQVEANIALHEQWSRRAAAQGCRLLAFPELSLTSYLREGAADLAFLPQDPRLDGLRRIAGDSGMIIVAGAPIRQDGQLYIGSFILSPDGSEHIYTKQYLHPGEDVCFTSSFDYDPLLEIDGHKIAFAICADTDHPEHPAAAAARGADLYVASIFFSANGLPVAHKNLGAYARQHRMSVLMANFCGRHWNTPCGGQSAFWHPDGTPANSLPADSEGLLVIDLGKAK